MMSTNITPKQEEARLLITLTTNDKYVLEYELSPPANRDSFFIFSLQKAGSVLVNQIIHHACRLHEVPLFEPEVIEFMNGFRLGSFDNSVLNVLSQRGYCFSGFRCLPEYLFDFDLASVKKILLIRDPRDILVSSYFSLRFSHELPSGDLGEDMRTARQRLNQTSVDAFALENVSWLQSVFEGYQRLETNSNMRLFRYEDVIFNKSHWICEMLEFLDLPVDDSEIQNILAEVDIIPQAEDPNSHIRRVTPGDHRNKLQPTTIAILNEILREILERYNYDISNPFVSWSSETPSQKSAAPPVFATPLKFSSESRVA